MQVKLTKWNKMSWSTLLFFFSAFSSTFLTKPPLSENSSIDAVVPAEHRCKYKASVANLVPRVPSPPPPSLEEGRERTLGTTLVHDD